MTLETVDFTGFLRDFQDNDKKPVDLFFVLAGTFSVPLKPRAAAGAVSTVSLKSIFQRTAYVGTAGIVNVSGPIAVPAAFVANCDCS